MAPCLRSLAARSRASPSASWKYSTAHRSAEGQSRPSYFPSPCRAAQPQRQTSLPWSPAWLLSPHSCHTWWIVSLEGSKQEINSNELPHPVFILQAPPATKGYVAAANYPSTDPPGLVKSVAPPPGWRANNNPVEAHAPPTADQLPIPAKRPRGEQAGEYEQQHPEKPEKPVVIARNNQNQESGSDEDESEILRSMIPPLHPPPPLDPAYDHDAKMVLPEGIHPPMPTPPPSSLEESHTDENPKPKRSENIPVPIAFSPPLLLPPPPSSEELAVMLPPPAFPQQLNNAPAAPAGNNVAPFLFPPLPLNEEPANDLPPSVPAESVIAFPPPLAKLAEPVITLPSPPSEPAEPVIAPPLRSAPDTEPIITPPPSPSPNTKPIIALPSLPSGNSASVSMLPPPPSDVVFLPPPMFEESPLVVMPAPSIPPPPSLILDDHRNLMSDKYDKQCAESSATEISMSWTPRTLAAVGPPSYSPPPVEDGSKLFTPQTTAVASSPPSYPPSSLIFLEGSDNTLPPPPGTPPSPSTTPPPVHPPQMPDNNKAIHYLTPPPTLGSPLPVPEIDEMAQPLRLETGRAIKQRNPPINGKYSDIMEPPPASVSTLPGDRLVESGVHEYNYETWSDVSGMQPPSHPPPLLHDNASVDSDGSWRKYVRPPAGPPPPLKQQRQGLKQQEQEQEQRHKNDANLGSQVDRILSRRRARKGANTLFSHRPGRTYNPPPNIPIRSPHLSTATSACSFRGSSDTTIPVRAKATMNGLPGHELARKQKQPRKQKQTVLEREDLLREQQETNTRIMLSTQRKWRAFSERRRQLGILEGGEYDKLRPGQIKREGVRVFGDSATLCESEGVQRTVRTVLAPVFRGFSAKVWTSATDNNDRWESSYVWVNYDCSKFCWSRAGVLKRPVSSVLNTSFVELRSVTKLESVSQDFVGDNSYGDDIRVEVDAEVKKNLPARPALRTIIIQCTDYGLQFAKKALDEEHLEVRFSFANDLDFEPCIYGLLLTVNLARLK